MHWAKQTVGILIGLGCLATVLAREVPVTILHTCDLHGNLLPTESYEGQQDVGGLARCATTIRQVRAEQPNTLLVDAGDTIQGATVSYLTDGQVTVKALNHLRYDVWVWGNHEFDWGLPKLAKCAEQAAMPILNANLHATTDSGLAAQIDKRVQPYVIHNVDGVKIALIGLNTPGIPNWSRPRLIPGLQFADSVETLRQIIPAVRRAGAQVIVLVCHQGYREAGDDHANQINAIARNFPELDVIIAGHTHRNFPEFKVSNILYCQAGYHGIHVGRVDLMFDTEKGRVTQRHSNTLLMDNSVAVDGDLLSLCQGELDEAAKHLKTVIGTATDLFGLRGAPKTETPIHTLLFEAIGEALKQRGIAVDAIIHGILAERATLPKGEVTIGDIWRIVPYENTVGVAQLTAGELREILEENAGMLGRQAFRGVWGLRWQFDPAAPVGQRTVTLQRRDGTALPEDRRLAVAFNSYDLASGGLRWTKLREIVERPEVKLTEYDFQTREAVIEYIRRHHEVSPSVAGWWKTVSATSAR